MKTKMKHKTTLSVFIFAFLLTGCVTALMKDIERAKAEGIPLIIYAVFLIPPNSAGGVDVNVFLRNTSGQSFKYVAFTVIPYNNVGDITPSEIGGETSARLKITGPIKSDDGDSGYWSNIWYNHSIGCIEIVEVEITYMNDRSERFAATELSKMMRKSVSNTCKI